MSKISRMRKTIALLLSIGLMACAASTPVSADWVKNNEKTYYEDENGEYLTGWQTIDGSKYYFNKKGVMKTGWVTMTNGNEYYFYKKTGKMATGWATINGDKYYFNKIGVLQHGYVKIKNEIYYFDEDSGYLICKVKDMPVIIDGKIYYCKPNGKLAKGMTDIVLSGKKYTLYFGDDYTSQTTTKTINGVTYIFEADKGLVDSYKKVPYSGYYDKDIKLVDFNIYIKGDKMYWTGYLENLSSIYNYYICIHADFYDSKGNVLETEHIMVLCDNLKAGQRYRIDNYLYIDSYSRDYTDLARIEFTSNTKHKAK